MAHTWKLVSGIYFFTGYKYVCSVMRFYCPPYCRKKPSYQISSLFDRYIDMGQRIPWKQYGLIVTIAGAPWAGLHGPNVIAKQFFFSHCDNLWKIGCQLFFLVVHMSPPRWGLHFRRLWYSWIWRTSARTPKNYKQNLSVVRNRINQQRGLTKRLNIFNIMLQGPRNILKYISHHIFCVQEHFIKG